MPQKRDMLVGKVFNFFMGLSKNCLHIASPSSPKILRHLLNSNPEGCHEFVKLMGEMLKRSRKDDDWSQCVGLFTLLSVLIRSADTEPFPTVSFPPSPFPA